MKLARLLFAVFAIGVAMVFSLVTPAFAATATVMATAINLQPIVGLLLQLALLVLAAVIALLLPKNLQIWGNKISSDNVTKLLFDAAHFAIAHDAPVAGMVGSIDVSNPLVATAANWFIGAASTEIKRLNLSDQDIINGVAAVIPQAKAAIAISTPPATQGTH